MHPKKRKLAYFRYQLTDYLIFHHPAGVLPKVLLKSFDQLHAMLSRYCKVTVIFAQLHQSEYSEKNQQLTRTLSELSAKLKAYYKSYMGFFWVREHKAQTKSHHYHIAIMLNGSECQSSGRVDSVLTQIWAALDAKNFSYRLKNRIYRLERHGKQEELRAVLMRMSYMAKAEGKVSTPSYTNSFGYSRVKAKDLVYR